MASKKTEFTKSLKDQLLLRRYCSNTSEILCYKRDDNMNGLKNNPTILADMLREDKFTKEQLDAKDFSLRDFLDMLGFEYIEKES